MADDVVNVLSVAGLIVIVIGSYYFLVLNKTYGIFYIFLGSAIDGLDGPLARTLNIQSDKGALIDSTIDRVGEMIIWSVICIKYVSSEIELFTVISIVTASGLIPYLRAKGETLDIEKKTDLLNTDIYSVSLLSDDSMFENILEERGKFFH